MCDNVFFLFFFFSERAPFAVASTNELVILINITDNNVHTLPIEARALSVDYDNQVLYWIGSKDGVCCILF